MIHHTTDNNEVDTHRSRLFTFTSPCSALFRGVPVLHDEICSMGGPLLGPGSGFRVRCYGNPIVNSSASPPGLNHHHQQSSVMIIIPFRESTSSGSNGSSLFSGFDFSSIFEFESRMSRVLVTAYTSVLDVLINSFDCGELYSPTNPPGEVLFVFSDSISSVESLFANGGLIPPRLDPDILHRALFADVSRMSSSYVTCCGTVYGIRIRLPSLIHCAGHLMLSLFRTSVSTYQLPGTGSRSDPPPRLFWNDVMFLRYFSMLFEHDERSVNDYGGMGMTFPGVFVDTTGNLQDVNYWYDDGDASSDSSTTSGSDSEYDTPEASPVTVSSGSSSTSSSGCLGNNGEYIIESNIGEDYV